VITKVVLNAASARSTVIAAVDFEIFLLLGHFDSEGDGTVTQTGDESCTHGQE